MASVFLRTRDSLGFLVSILFAILLFSLPLSCGAGGREALLREEMARKTRVLLITVDGLSPESLGSLTQSLRDRTGVDLSQGGVRFTRCFTPVPECLPGSISLLTGRSPVDHGVLSRRQKFSPGSSLEPSSGLASESHAVPSLPEILRKKDVYSFAVVSRDSLMKRSGLDVAFQSYEDRIPHRFDPESRLERSRPGIEVGQVADRVLRALVERSFFGWIHLSDLLVESGELGSPPRTGSKSNSDDGVAPGSGGIEAVSEGLAPVVETLQQAGVLESTLVVITSTRAGVAPGASLDAALLELSSLRVPLLVHLPAWLPAGTRVDVPVSLTDVAPSIVNLLPGAEGDGRSVEGGNEGQGRDLISLCFSPKSNPETEPITSVSVEPWERYGLSPLVSSLAFDGEELRRLVLGRDWEVTRLIGSGEAREGRGEGSRIVGYPDVPGTRSMMDGLYRALRLPAEFGRELEDPRSFVTGLRHLEACRRELDRGRFEAAKQHLALLGSSTLPGAKAWVKAELGLRQEAGFDAGVELLEGVLSRLGERSSLSFEILRGRLLLAAGRYREASESLDRARRTFPDAPELVSLLGASLRLQGRIEEASLALEEGVGAFPGAGEVFLESGKLFEVRGETEEAVGAYRRAILADKGSREPRVLLGRLLLGMGRFEEAVEHLVTASQFRGIDPELAFDCGRAYEGVGAAEQALQAYRVSKAFGLRENGARWRIGVVLRGVGETGAAIAELQELADRKPEFDHGLRDLISLLAQEGRFTLALQRLEELFSKSPDDVWGLQMKSALQVSQGEEAAGLATLERAHSTHPDNPGVQNDLAWLLITAEDRTLRDPARAVEFSEDAVRADPENLDFQDTRMRALLLDGRLERVLGMVGELARGFRAAGRTVEGLAILEAVLEASPDRPGELEDLRKVYRRELDSGLSGSPRGS